MFKGKTFFPAHWSREKVISKIYEAYDNFIARGAHCLVAPDGKYLITGLTKEKIKIRIHMTKEGLVTTAYPILE